MIANVHTTVEASKTVAEIQSMLSGARAKRIVIEYDDQGLGSFAESICFSINIEFKDSSGQTQHRELSFMLKANWLGTYQAMKRDRVAKRLLTKQQAVRVSWRVLRDWLRAQLSLIASGAATLEQVMLPWAVTADGETTVAEKLLGSQSPFLLEAKMSP